MFDHFDIVICVFVVFLVAIGCFMTMSRKTFEFVLSRTEKTMIWAIILMLSSILIVAVIRR